MPDSEKLSAFLSESGYVAVPLRRTAVGQLVVEATVNHQAAQLVLDTGASGTVIDRDRAPGFGLKGDEETEAVGCGSSQMATRAQLQDLAVETVREADLEVTLVDLSHVNRAIEARTGTPIDGILGTDLLIRREAIIDIARGLLHLK